MRNIMTIEDVYHDLHKKIETLELTPGLRISENDLSKEYNVSRHIIRGAFNRLKEDKLIEVYPQRGTYVSMIDMKLIDDYIFVRESIELRNMYDVLRLDDVDELCERLIDNIEKQEKITELKGYCDEYQELDMEFHKILLRSTGRGDVLDLLKSQGTYLRRWKNMELNFTKRLPKINQQHRDLVIAIKEKDLQKSRKILHEHLACVYNVGEEVFEEYGKFIIRD